MVIQKRTARQFTMEAIKIDLNDYEYAGEGANGQSFNHRTDKSIMMKLYNKTAPYEITENELRKAKLVYDAGIPTPRPGDFITDGNGRYGIRFERIVGKKSFARAVSDNPEDVENLARRFALMCRELHSREVDTGTFQDIKEVDRQLLERNTFFTEEEKKDILRFLESVPDRRTAIHGDLQYGNAIMVGDRQYFIDLGDFAYGHPYFDLGMVMLTTKYEDEEFLKEAFHLTPDVAGQFWHFFVKGYWGEDADEEEIERILLPFTGLKVLIIERDTQMFFPRYHELLKGISLFQDIK